MRESDVDTYAYNLLEEVRALAETNDSDPQEAFASVMLEQLAGDGLTEDPAVVRFRDHGVEVSGFGVTSDNRSLDLFITNYSPRADHAHKINRTEIEAAFRRLENFVSRSLSGALARKDPSSEVTGLIRRVVESYPRVDRVRFLLITNARSVTKDPIVPIQLHGRAVTREVWDLRRLANWTTSGSRAEPIIAEFPAGLPCLGTPNTTDDYSVLLTIVPGVDLAELYARHGARLLELNVRSFLQVRGAVNAGIQRTLREYPERFLAYNNGIAATASAVDFDEGGPDQQRRIRRIYDLQIVNGGQTTASIHHARRTTDISSVLVQMKLTVVSPERLDEIVPRISAYSNTQNKVTASDLKANSGFHVDVERIMRTLWAPPGPTHDNDTHWFYERARGQYANALAAESTRSRQKIFKEINPASQKITKSELAKYEASWAMLPQQVCLGAEKNFTLFSEWIDQRQPLVDKDYCQRLVAKAILFRQADRLVARQNFGGYKANIVAYTVAKIAHATGSRVDLDRVWREQAITPALTESLTEISILVQKIITSPPGSSTHVGEWTKKDECWEAVRDIDWVPPPTLNAELTPLDSYTDDVRALRDSQAGDWQDLAAWGASTGTFDDQQRAAVRDVAHALAQGNIPAGKQLRAASRLMGLALDGGFRPSQPPNRSSEAARRA
ncbi:AIPR family protein [Solwaraspora sp. WMMA2065]|uniref:AIPR family protein n=1 Tax=Solwaraspora sp. WMMA2065 TaxID=3015166 RepID=UPI00259BF367|nr:AIPR family protein [Solwaraspora sp. WMMA2065]WJK32717.1 AIPR family protein [Solwaraspora sp. WMMA2065]